MATTAQDIFDRIKWQTDVKAARLVNTDVLPFINLAYREAWDLMVASYEDYFVKLHTPATGWTLAGGLTGNTFQITATDFYKVKGVQMLFGSRWSDPLETFEFNEWGSPDSIRYRQEGDTLYFEPNETLAGLTFRLWYVYKPADLALGDTLVDVNGWVEQFMIDTVAIRVLGREETDASLLSASRAQIEARIKKMASNRNAGKSRRVARTRLTRRRARNRTRTGMYLP